MNKILAALLINLSICFNLAWSSPQQIYSDLLLNGDSYGSAVDANSNFAIVGAPGTDAQYSSSGAAYIYQKVGNSWINEVRVIPSDGYSSGTFGNSVAISDSFAVVGAERNYHNGNFSGAAYIFKFDGTTWNQTQKLIPSFISSSNYFGSSVAISDSLICVGAEGYSDNGSYAGSAYIFKYDGTSWVEEAKLLASDGFNDDRFGTSVDIDNDKVVIGSYRDDDNGGDSGSAYVFEYDGGDWNETAKLLASDGNSSDEFGRSVAISNNYIIVGAWFDDDNGSNSGSAYVFHFDGTNWNEEIKFSPNTTDSNDYFGYSVDITNGYAIVGSPRDHFNGINAELGSAYVYKLNGSSWGFDSILIPNYFQSNNYYSYFGNAVCITPNFSFVGASQYFLNTNNAGNAFSFAVADYPTAGIMVSPNPVNFGKIQPNQTNTKDVKIWNFTPTKIGFTNPVFSNSDFSGNVSADSIDIENFKTLQLSFTPTTGGNFDETLSLSNNIGADLEIELEGFGSVPNSNEHKILSSDGDPGDYWGKVVSISGDYAAVGRETDDSNGTNTGAVYLFKRINNSWVQDVKLTAIDGNPNDKFGHSVKVHNGYLFVNAYEDDELGYTNNGSVYVYKFINSTWVLQAKLMANDTETNHYFGRAIDASGNYLSICANGSVYIFENLNGTWTQVDKIVPTVSNSSFGQLVDISGNRLIVGASNSAYIFQKVGNVWVEEIKLTGNTSVGSSVFATSVAISGDYAFVGDYKYDVNKYGFFQNSNSNWGRVYVYKRVGIPGLLWANTQNFYPHKYDTEDNFGKSISMSGNYALVGAPGNDSTGVAYLYQLEGSSWVEKEQIRSFDGEINDHFGEAVQITGGRAIISAIYDEDFGYQSGSAYIYDIELVANLEISANSFDFGGISINQSLTQDFTLISNGELDATIDSVKIVGNGFTTTLTPQTINYGDSLTFSVTFSPDSESNFVGTLEIYSNDWDEGLIPITLLGEGIDIFPPSPITDFTILDSSLTSVILGWTSVGDDSSVGQAASYEIRYSLNPINDFNFSSGIAVNNLPTPKVSGLADTLEITNLTSGLAHYFGIKVTDNAGNSSPLTTVKLEPYLNSPIISSISDVKNDNGGKVRINFIASENDTSQVGVNVGSYVIFRKVNPNFSPQKGSGNNQIFNNLPTGNWDQVLTLNALGIPNYSAVVPTLADSNSTGTHNFEFIVVAQAFNSPWVFSVSNIGTGYSVDNIAPSIPSNQNFVDNGSGQITASWNTVSANDLFVYKIYALLPNDSLNLVQQVVPQTNQATQTQTFAEIPNALSYGIASVDINDNEEIPFNRIYDLMISNLGNSVVLTWSAKTNATGYKVYRSQTPNISDGVFVGSVSNNVFIDFDTITNNSSFYYFVTYEK